MVDAMKVVVGDELEISGYSVRARVIGVMDDIVVVAIGSLRTKIRCSQIVRRLPASNEVPRRTYCPSVIATSVDVDIHGMRADEAREAIERGLDDALRSGTPHVRLIHGKGTGVLRAVVAEVLTEHTEVHAFEMARSTDGGEGVTIATLEAWIS
ncbi:MAG: hypothetical protein CL790_05945 [Chloroflexi bacterium]|nr:hypothetical protein [Chloroflexota bacterium]|tara:strand:- start:7092 stop:7553 length:462 start_codon:yes stop_codon:yes gene_type:complete